MKKLLLYLPLFLLTINTYAQGYYNKWCLKYGSFLDFNTGKAVHFESVPTTMVQNNWPQAGSTISDIHGNLLFYTNQLVVLNAKHDTMPNGIISNSVTFNTQLSLIVPNPGNINQYYSFSMNAIGLGYAIIDMTLDGGLGDVVTNKPGVLNDSIIGLTTAIRMPNGKDFWIVAHNCSDAFYAYKLTAAGVDPNPIISHVGNVLKWNISSGFGYLKASPQGDKLAMSINKYNTYEIYDFDKNTGMVSNPISLPPHYPSAYGVEFSPDGSRLYLSGGGLQDTSKAYIYQLNLKAGNATAIINSATLIAKPLTTTGHIKIKTGHMGGLQAGPDCKIYAAKQDTCYLSVINNPNALGIACNYVDNQLLLPINSGQPPPTKPNPIYLYPRDLPNFFEMTCTSPITVNLGKDTLLCNGQTLTLNAGIAQSYLWSTGATDSSIVVAISGTYWVKVGNGQFYGTDTIKVIFNPMPQVELGKDTTICQQQHLQLDAGSANAYLWSTGATTASINVSTAGNYWVKASNGPCEATDSITVAECKKNDIEFPNVFTPNSDNHNNVFKPIQYSGIASAVLEIYNRWGKKVYSTKDPIQGWDGLYNGTSCAEGVYYWSLQYTTFLNESKFLKGFVTLLK